MNVLLTRLTVALVLGTVTGSISARPADAEKTPPLRSSYDQCLDETQGVTVAINNCIGSEYDFQDQRLNTAYKALRQSLSEDQQRRALRDQERAWIADRDKACAAPADGGTADMLGANECRLNRTALRAAELEAQLAHP
jgi:uncharacterized protein YecT (DUF1311 family)